MELPRAILRRLAPMRLGGATVLGALALACASQGGERVEPARPETAKAAAPPEPGQGRVLASDLRESDPRAAAMAALLTPHVEAIRGLRFRRSVRIGVLEPSELRAQIEREFEEEVEPDEIRAKALAFEAMGLIPDGFDLFAAVKTLYFEETAGFYDAKRKQLFLTGEDFRGSFVKSVMVHELCHALEDQHYDLRAIDERLRAEGLGNDDRRFAFSAATEGSAMVVMGEWIRGAALDDLAQASPDLDGDDSMDGPTADLDGDDSVTTIAEGSILHPEWGLSSGSTGAQPPILVLPLTLAYTQGEAFFPRTLSGVVAAADWARVYSDPPLSSEQILHPEKYWDPLQRDEPLEIVLPDFTAELGPGWRRIGENVLGELGVMVMTSDFGDGEDPSLEMDGDHVVEEGPLDEPEGEEDEGEPVSTPEATGWGGDRYAVYLGPEMATGERSIIVVWASIWDSPDDAFEMWQFLDARGSPPELHVKRSGSRVAAVFAKGFVKPEVCRRLTERALVEFEERPARAHRAATWP